MHLGIGCAAVHIRNDRLTCHSIREKIKFATRLANKWKSPQHNNCRSKLRHKKKHRKEEREREDEDEEEKEEKEEDDWSQPDELQVPGALVKYSRIEPAIVCDTSCMKIGAGGSISHQWHLCSLINHNSLPSTRQWYRRMQAGGWVREGERSHEAKQN